MVVAQYLLTFREVLEAALLSAIVLAFLVKTGRSPLARPAWYGILAGVAASVALGVGIWLAYGSLSESSQVLFEGVAALIAVAVLTSMIYWMAVRGRTIRTDVERRVAEAVSQGAIIGIASLTFILVFREGLETVLFLTPFLVQDVGATFLGAGLGLAAGVALAFGIFRVGLKLNLRRFFYFTSVLLILIAGGLLGYGVHELIEYAELQGIALGWWASNAWSLNIPPESIFHHKGVVGAILAVMFGYTVRAEWGRAVAHFAYLAVALPLVIAIYQKPERVAAWVARIRAVFRPARATPPADPP